jgi:hypothetical protein
MKLRVFILLLLTTYCILQSCKYEDGPIISFRSAERRLQGEFNADAFNIDGQDAINIWTDSICNDYLMMHWSDAGIKTALSINADFGNCGGKYNLLDNNKTLEFEIRVQTGQYPGYGPFHLDKISRWTILKLSNKKLWIETTFEGHEYYLKLNKTKDMP